MANTEQSAEDRSAAGSDGSSQLHRERLYRAVTSVTREPDTAIEAVDMAMARAAERWDVLGESDNPSGWVYRAALRRSRPLLRKRRRSQTAGLGTTTLPDPDVNAAVASLPYRLRVVIVARFYLDWSAQQIAVALRLPERIVNGRLRRALRRIERSLGGSS